MLIWRRTFIWTSLRVLLFLEKKTVCRLKKYLYGPKQSLRQWYKRFNSFMISNSFQSHSMIVLFISSLLVDHLHTCWYMLIATKSMKEIVALKEQLSREFDMKDLGATKKILGMEIIRDRKSRLLYLS
jgi:hypothetical protein